VSKKEERLRNQRTFQMKAMGEERRNWEQSTKLSHRKREKGDPNNSLVMRWKNNKITKKKKKSTRQILSTLHRETGIHYEGGIKGINSQRGGIEKTCRRSLNYVGEKNCYSALKGIREKRKSTEFPIRERDQ